MKYNGIYTIINTTFPYGRKNLVVVKEQEGDARVLFSCYIRKRLTRCFIERNWDRKRLWSSLKVIDTRKYIKDLEKADKLAKWYEI